MYVDFEYYSSVFSGSVLSEKDFQKAEQEAETYIRYLTYLNGDIFADTAQVDAIKGAVCAAADAYYMAVRETAEGGNVKSESKDGLSVSFVVARKDGETADDYAGRHDYGLQDAAQGSYTCQRWGRFNRRSDSVCSKTGNCKKSENHQRKDW